MAKKPNKRPIQQVAPVRPAATNDPVKKVQLPKQMLSVTNLCIALCVVCFALYFNTLWNGYILDDIMVLKDNTMVTQGTKAIPELLSTPHMRGYLIIPNDLYRPLSLVMFAIEYQFFGLNPMVGHFFNIVVFAGCVVLLFLFLNKFFKGEKTAIAFIAALIFAVHPIHTEVVANIKSRDELLCYFFAFMALNFFMNYMKNGKMLQLIMGVIVLFLSYISKETVISFLAIIPLIFFFYNNENRQRAIFITAGTVVSTAIFLFIRNSVLNTYNANQPGAPVEFIDNALAKAHGIERIATEVKVLGIYLFKMFIPYPLLCNYSFNAIPKSDLSDIWFWLSLVAYGALIYLAITRFIKDKKDPWAFCIIFFLATIFLFSNIPFLMGAELAERFAFFASTSVCLAAALAFEKWIIKSESNDILILKNSKVLMVLVPLCLLFGGMTMARNTDWKDELTLYMSDVKKSPNDCRLYHYIGTALAENVYATEPDSNKRRELDVQSMDYLRHSLSIYNDFTEAHVELGRIYDRKHMYDSAIVHDKKALELNPTHPTANNNLGSVFLSTGRYAEAIVYLNRSVMLNPNFKYAYLNLARSHMQLKHYDSAIYNFRMMLRFDPKYIDAEQEMGSAFYMLCNFDSAAYHYKQVLTINPNDPNAVNNLGAIYLNARKFPEAIEYFKKTIAANPNFVNAYSNLSHAYFLSGQYQLAIETIMKELTIDKNPRDVPYIALCYQKLGNMAEAKKYEAIAKQYYSNFRLE
jgi:tetratricopeptide (TPR) repeat protein